MDQSILATRLVVRFFREHGHKHLDTMKLKPPTSNSFPRPQAERVERPPDVRRIGGGSEGGNYQDLILYMNSQHNQRGEMSGVAESIASLLSSLGVTATHLITACSAGPSLDWLASKLQPLRADYPGVHIRNLARTVIAWTSTKRSVRSDLGPVYRSLLAFRQFLVKYLPTALSQSPHTSPRGFEGLAEEYLKSLTALGFSHFNLKTEFDKGEERFRRRLYQHLNEIHAEISSEVDIDILVSLAVRYFRVNF